MRQLPFRQLACLLLMVAGCATGTREDDSDRQGDALSSIQQHAHVNVCNGGRVKCFSHIRVDAQQHVQAAAAPQGFGPPDLQDAYKLTGGAGTGTIAIVDAYDYPNAESDLAKYRSQYGLPACTTANGCFKKVNQTGAASPLPAKAPANDDWTVEMALDLDLASAACPTCKLVLVEAQDDQGNGLDIANNAAASLGTVVSNSWGGPESGQEASEEQYFNHPGVAIFVAAGDDGYNDGGQGPDYPSTSAHTIAVGGTSLVKSSNARGWTEGAWNDGGSSCSKSIAKPSWQSTTSACTKRMTSDVSAVGDPNTGLAVYNAASGGWTVVGGTSAASPFVAAVFARYGLGAQTAQFAYTHAADFFDVTTGKNGTCGSVVCNAGAGWDGPTGIGSPNGVALSGGTTTTCTPACSGKTCGDDGCGGTCGTCDGGQTCSAGVCMGGGGGTTGTGSGTTGGGGTTGGDTCAHPVCSTGGDLEATCDSCAADVCAKDSYCCETAWDSQCVGEVAADCGETCGTSSTCSHSICTAGAKLTKTCDTCAAKVCAADSYCCGTKWDSQCVSEVGSVCGESCN